MASAASASAVGQEHCSKEQRIGVRIRAARARPLGQGVGEALTSRSSSAAVPCATAWVAEPAATASRLPARRRGMDRRGVLMVATIDSVPMRLALIRQCRGAGTGLVGRSLTEGPAEPSRISSLIEVSWCAEMVIERQATQRVSVSVTGSARREPRRQRAFTDAPVR